MLKKLQQHWGVNGWRFFLILCTFAVTGTFTAWMSKSITGWLDIERFSLAWWLIKITVFLIGYQIFILFFGFCFGQFSFFWKYEKKILSRMGLVKKQTEKFRIVIFASGAGSNARNIIEYFKASPVVNGKRVTVSLIVCNKPGAGVLQIAEENRIDVLQINRDDFAGGERLTAALRKRDTDLIILAGFLWKLPAALVSAYPRRIINIHPALLPRYGGKGMYGTHVHEAVIKNKEKESGITIHYADEVYDNGEIIFQASCAVDHTDDAGTLAEKIHALERRHFPETIAAVIKSKINVKTTGLKTPVKILA
jgi:formyltetrahydrofolate-dependent phosphoribosylglycinamide formyltransferase